MVINAQGAARFSYQAICKDCQHIPTANHESSTTTLQAGSWPRSESADELVTKNPGRRSSVFKAVKGELNEVDL